MKKILIFTSVVFVLGLLYVKARPNKQKEEIPFAKVERGSFDVDVKTVGELEAARSTIIASSIKGDLGKIIYLITDGINIKPGEVLVKMDPTPFEEKLEKIQFQIKEQESNLVTVEKTLEWEKSQVENEGRTAIFEVETAELELNKLVQGDGPLEIGRLWSAMQKAWLKYDELNGYSEDLLNLQEQGYLNPTELQQAQKKLQEEKEAYESAKMQYDSYVNHVYPMLVKKAETALKRAKLKQEDTTKSGIYKIGKSQAALDQAKRLLRDLHFQIQEAKKELDYTEIKAPAPGMVVHREEFRSGQKRKPRIGDILVKNHPLIDLPDLESMIVKTKIREIDLYKIGIGKKATIHVDAYPQAVFSGTISSIGVLALSDLARASEEKYFEVRVALDKSDERLRPGMTTRVTIHAQHIEDSIMVPIHAIFEENKQNFCYVDGLWGYDKRAVEIGVCNEQWAQVLSGLEEGECACLMKPSDKDKS